MTRTIHGTLHGRTIELEEDVGLADGAEVEVLVQPAKRRQEWGEGIKRAAGVGADTSDFDEVFEQIAKERRTATFRGESS